MTTSKSRTLSILLAALAAVSLAACGGGGGSGGAASPLSPTKDASGSANLAACTDGNYDTNTYQGITPCLTVTGLASGQSVSVSDGTTTLTESSDGTFNFPGLANATENGAPVDPTVAFSITVTSGGATCSLSGGGAGANNPSATGYETSALCSKYPAVSPDVPKVTTMPGASGTAQVIASPTIVPVYISTGSLATGNESNDATFLSQLVNSQEWGLLSQYGVGAATVDAAVTVNPGSWSQYYGVQKTDVSTIAQGVQSQGVTLTASTVLVIYLPPTIGLDSAGTGQTGYTGTVAVGGTNVPFALVTDNSTNGQYIAADSVYWMAEAGIVNDVSNADGNGYAWMSANPDLWLGTSVTLQDTAFENDATTVGIGTLCMSGDGAGPLQAPDIATGDIVPIWSQTDANAGRNPCQPNADYYDTTQSNPTVTLSDSNTPFVGVVAQGTTAVTGTLGGISRTDQAIVITPGQSVTVQAQVFATAAVQDMPVRAGVLSYISGLDTGGCSFGSPGGVQPWACSSAPLISVSAVKNVTRPNASGVNNGDIIEFTVTASSTPFKGMYVIAVMLGNEQVATPLAVTNGTTWQ
jgi:hypothetical protein